MQQFETYQDIYLFQCIEDESHLLIYNLACALFKLIENDRNMWVKWIMVKLYKYNILPVMINKN